MPHYFLHLRDESGDLTNDQDGAMYADLPAALLHARTAAWEMMAERMRFHGSLGDGRSFEITDRTGVSLASVQFADLVASGRA